MDTSPLTLDQAWDLCLELWEHLSNVCPEALECDEKESFSQDQARRLSREVPVNSCWFCEFSSGFCDRCPAAQVQPEWRCMSDYRGPVDYKRPLAFYNELLRLNALRKASK